MSTVVFGGYAPDGRDGPFGYGGDTPRSSSPRPATFQLPPNGTGNGSDTRTSSPMRGASPEQPWRYESRYDAPAAPARAEAMAAARAEAMAAAEARARLSARGAAPPTAAPPTAARAAEPTAPSLSSGGEGRGTDSTWASRLRTRK